MDVNDEEEILNQLSELSESNSVKIVGMRLQSMKEDWHWHFHFSKEELKTAHELVSTLDYLRKGDVVSFCYSIPIRRSTRFSDRTIYTDQLLNVQLDLDEIKLENAKKNPDAPQALKDKITEDINCIKAELKFREEETTQENDDDIPF